MASHRINDNTQEIARCAICAVMAEAACRGAADANTACTVCGLPAIDLADEYSSYFEVIMRLGRPGPAA